jgi:predicted nucleic acid-binding protein
MIVVDAMILAYFLLRHPRFTDSVDRVFDDAPTCCGPALWRSELRNVLMKYVRAEEGAVPGSELDLPGALQRMERAEALIAGRTFDVDTKNVLRLAHDSDCSPYDGEYVALAQDLDTRLVTTDGPVLEAFPDTAVHPANFAPNGGEGAD